MTITNKALTAQIPLITLITIVTYSIGHASISSMLDYFEIPTDMYEMDITSGLWMGGAIILSWILNIGGISSLIFISLTIIAFATLPRITIKKSFRLLIYIYREMKIIKYIINSGIIFIIFIEIIRWSVIHGRNESIKIESNLSKKINIMTIIIEDCKTPIAGVEIYNGNSYISILTEGGPISVNKEKIKSILHHRK